MSGETIDRERLLAILEYWHRIEFFIPFDLSACAEPRDGRAPFWMHAETLENDTAYLRRPNIPEGKELTGIRLFFGVFDKSQMTDSILRYCAPASGLAAFEDVERGDLEGDTCFASLDLDANGVPLFDRFSISTLPWALGRIAKGGLMALSLGAFAESMKKLKELLENFRAQRHLDRSGEADGAEAITPAEILALNDLLQDWAGFKPEPGRPVALAEIRFREKLETSVRQLEAPQIIDMIPAEGDEDEEDDEPEVEQEIGILNSFYLEDIEKAIACVRDGVVPEAIRQYLTPLEANERLDLYSDAGRLAILEKLHPSRVNRGRWPSDPSHAMSLMQQFAINAAGELGGKDGLFSVNGPPGTGKTTLLRDVIADNIVKRARVLAALPSPRDAFTGRGKKMEFADGATATISILKPELTGFEMVVASSNNTAVENISKDLPKRKSIWDLSSVDYLQPVAHKVAAQTKKGGFQPCKGEEQPWGLISCVLGNFANRRSFGNKFAFKPRMNGEHTTWKDGHVFQSIYGWLDNYEGPSFAEAVEAFRRAEAEVDAGIARHARYADLFGEVGLRSQDDYCRAASAQAKSAAEALETSGRAHDGIGFELQATEARLSGLKEEERLLDRTSPAWWHRLFRTRAGQEYRASMVENAKAQLSVRGRQSLLRETLASHAAEMQRASARLQQCEAALAARQHEWKQKRAELEQLGEALGNPAIPGSLSDLETDRFQISGLWHTEAMATLRSALFEAALRLHAAWLAEAGRSGGGFRGNIPAISKLLSGNLPVEKAAIASIWQSLFMIVPVISTTFASFTRLFNGVEAGGIGWLFIDEAGQAVPQAAVGGLMRARRVMAIGDPLQIEPVFTLPAAFIKALGELSPHTAGGDYSPARTSVQTLADAANRFGTAVATDADDDPLWIGSPLRVHRRCIDPMFSLANRIAYHGKMVFAARGPSEDFAPLHDSAWIDIRGRVTGKQTVREQVEFMVRVLLATYRSEGRLPGVYIISPFKETKAALRQAIEKAYWINPDGRHEQPKGLDDWLKNRIGTVHTFQGKEEDTVFMVLGTDAEHRGAAVWAASKPNLLNVAATRARYRLFIIGDSTLWSGLPYFSDAADMLPVVQEEDFLARL
ncbi:ATP-binding protein [Brucella endophytica]|uniref:ATP-binding protein n=1 Tax=Brucella endophytica TaxID=1963359 RepID=A0A916WL88_9HYPH|nr:ATP-binding protein [Brucella endophytica]GGB08589.1 ATP-binding protein [Brucella endophytica]